MSVICVEDLLGMSESIMKIVSSMPAAIVPVTCRMGRVKASNDLVSATFLGTLNFADTLNAAVSAVASCLTKLLSARHQPVLISTFSTSFMISFFRGRQSVMNLLPAV